MLSLEDFHWVKVRDNLWALLLFANAVFFFMAYFNMTLRIVLYFVLDAPAVQEVNIRRNCSLLLPGTLTTWKLWLIFVTGCIAGALAVTTQNLYRVAISKLMKTGERKNGKTAWARGTSGLNKTLTNTDSKSLNGIFAEQH